MSPDTVSAPTVRAAQIGSWPGGDFGAAQRIAFAETPDLPCLPELPARGPGAGMIGRAASLLAEIGVDLQPSGWRISRGDARDQRVARALLRDDLDRLEEEAQGYRGPVKLAVAGPWTLAASIESHRGEKLLADPGARKELAESLAEGISELTGELGRRLPDVVVRWQIDEPLAGSVATGGVSTASGLHRYRTIDTPELVTLLDLVVAAAGDHCWLHSCASDAPWTDLVRTAADGFSFDAMLTTADDWDLLGAALEQGRSLALGVVAADGPVPTPDQVARGVLRRWESLGLGDEAAQRLWLTPSCGLAGRTESEALDVVRALRRGAAIVTEELAG